MQTLKKEDSRSALLEKAIEGLPLKETLIVDCHCHMGYTGDFWIPNAEPGEMIKIMDKVGQKMACVSHNLAIGPDYNLGNDLVSWTLKEYPDRFIGYCVINPNYPDDVLPELKRCFTELGMSAIKLHPGFHDYPISGPNYEPVFEYAEEYRLTILSHQFDEAENLEKLSTKYPHVNFIVGHGIGWDGRKPEKTFDVVKKRNNVFLDTACSTLFNGVIESVVHYVGADKVLYGSDFPYLALRSPLGRIIYAKIDDEEKKKILGLNVAKILGISK